MYARMYGWHETMNLRFPSSQELALTENVCHKSDSDSSVDDVSFPGACTGRAAFDTSSCLPCSTDTCPEGYYRQQCTGLTTQVYMHKYINIYIYIYIYVCVCVYIYMHVYI
jgi:hypothetical protein